MEPRFLTRAGLARRYQVNRSTIGRALDNAAEAAAEDPTVQVPQPLNQGEPTEVFDVNEFDAFWKQRPRPGRRWPTATDEHW